MNTKLSRVVFVVRIIAILFAVLLSAPVRAQTNVVTNATREITARYLFIVDTSSAMRRRAEAVRKSVENLFRSGMTAKLVRGDSIGIWTFNDTLSAGRFPLQSWSPEAGDGITSNAVAFLKAQKYTGESQFAAAVPTLDRLIKSSERLVIFLVSDGNEKISGTPFDRTIAGSFQQAYAAQEKARMPFITVFVVHRGRMVDASINLAPWPVMIPDFPPDPPKVVEAPKPPPKKEAPRPTVPPLIVIGKKPPETNAPPVAPTNAVPVAPAPASGTPPTTNNASATLPTDTNSVPATIIAANVESNVPPPSANVAAATRPGTVTPTPPALTPDIVVAAEKAADQPPTIKADAAPLVPTAPANVKPLPTATEASAKPSESVAQKDEAPTHTETTTAKSRSTNAPAIGSLAVTTGDTLLSRWPLAAIGGAFILLAVWLGFVMRQRMRDRERGSLITSSFDRGGK